MSDLTKRILEIPLTKAPRKWWYAFGVATMFTGIWTISVVYLIYRGPGIWGINRPSYWGFAVANFVWWIGIGHAGTFISAVLLLCRQTWRTSVSRLAEAMTIFAVMCAGLFPIIHLGRPWFFYWVLPYPNSMNIYSQFRSPFVWDAFAITTYILVSLIFWYLGMMPDFGAIRDGAEPGKRRFIYACLALGWRGDNEQWRKLKVASLLLAGLATPLVISVHSIVALDFASGIVPGWGLTVFPPFFVAGAVYSGLAMVLVLAISIRSVYALQAFITVDHLEKIARLMLATAWMVTYGYTLEAWNAWSGGDHHEWLSFLHKVNGHYGWLYWTMILVNCIFPQVFWSPTARKNIQLLFVAGVLIVLGMWVERFMIIVPSLEADYLQTAWGEFSPTMWDWAVWSGTVGLFFFFYLLFVRFAPMIAVHELREETAKRRVK